MDGKKALRCLSNSISRFVHLVSSLALKNIPCESEYRDVVSSLKLFKPLLDGIAGSQACSGEVVCKEHQELDVAINEAREFVEKWGPHMSNICGVVKSRELIFKIHGCSTKICQTLRTSLDSSSQSSSSTLVDIQNCIQEFQSLKMETASEKIEEALKCIKDGKNPLLELLIEVIELLHLTSSQELLKESIAVEKEYVKAKKSDQIDHIVDLLSRIRETMVKVESFKVVNGVPVPSYFRCPLSLELMFDPVIVATGQTYERGSIEKWLNHGLTGCAITRQTLSHTNLIPNYTVKALIQNWCDENYIKVNNTTSEHHCKPEDSTSYEVENGFERLVFEKSKSKSNHSSPDESCSESTSTASSSKHESSREMASGFSPWLSGKQYHSSNQVHEMVGDGGNHSLPRSASLPSESSSNDLTTSSHVENLVNDLKSSSTNTQTKAAAELRFLAKHNTENRVIIGQSGAVQPLLSLLHSNDKMAQEHAVTALLNLSINGNLKSMIAEAGTIEPLIHVLKTGNPCAKENSAAALFSLSVLEEYRIKIGRSSAVKALVDLLGSGTLRGKKDAATALFNLSIFHENKARIIQAGAVKYLVELLDPPSEMVDKAVALLSNLSTVSEGCLEIVKEGGIPLLVEIVETGSQRGKENAASILFQLCLTNRKYCRLVLQEGVVPPLVALSLSGTSRAKEKAQQLLSHFRNQRENPSGRAKS